MKSARPAKTKQRSRNAVEHTRSADSSSPPVWPYAAALLVALFAVLEVYWPAVNGPFVLDDTYLPYGLRGYADTLSSWMSGMRPVLMMSFWLNYQHAATQDTFPYHLTNFVLHFFDGILIFFAARKLLAWGGEARPWADVLAGFAAGLFLLHPVQTEAVSYVASRSETLSVFFLLAAFVIFLYRPREGVGVGRAAAILALFGLAVMTKEHTAVLPALLLLTDLFWSSGPSLAGVRRNWKLYVPITLGGVLGLAFVWRTLHTANSAGFQFGAVSPTQYFFTECRAIWNYVLLFFLPVGQNLDVDFGVSRGLGDPRVIAGLAGLIGTTAAAWIGRKRFPLASYGWLVFLLLIAPTSSFVPIQDPFAERRLYLPFIGLLLVVLEFVRRWNVSRGVLMAILGVVLVAEATATYQRNQLWANAVALWQDTAAKSPRKVRPSFQLAFAYYLAGECPDAVAAFDKAARIEPPKADLLIDWALASDCAGNSQAALEELHRAAALEPSAHVYQLIGNEYGKTGRYPDALDAIDKSIKLDPNFWMSYYTRGNVYLVQGDKTHAADEFRHVLAIDPNNEQAREALAKIGS